MRVVSLSIALRVGGFRTYMNLTQIKSSACSNPIQQSEAQHSRLLRLGQRPSHGYTHAYKDTY
jgi:hypothetical protein